MQLMDNHDYLLVGLGNPGSQYRDNRHNIGFRVIDHFLARYNGDGYSEKWQSEYRLLTIGGKKVHLLKPLTYMNLSGKSVSQFRRFFKVETERMVVIHDDLDMHPGRIKLVRGGGSGGHNGIKSLVELLGTAEFYRLKFGIGRPGKGEVHPLFPVERYVLSDFSTAEAELLRDRLPLVVEGLTVFLNDSPEKAMGLLNVLK